MATPARALGAGLLIVALGALAAAGGIPWNAAASTAPSPATRPVAFAPASDAPLPAGAPDVPLLSDDPVDGTSAGPDARRTPKQIAAVLERKLLALKEARARGDAQAAARLTADLLAERTQAHNELPGQLGRGTSTVYWAVTLLRDAVEQDDDAAIDRALRYLRATAGR